MKMFIDTGVLTSEKTSPLKSIDFIYEVLVPEVAIRLIQDDYSNDNITLEHAQEILIDSIRFGEYIHSNEVDI
jgi:hypothetical protein